MNKLILDVLDQSYKINLDWKIKDYLETFYPNYKLAYVDYFQKQDDWDEIIRRVVGIPLHILERCKPEHKEQIIAILSNIKSIPSNIKTIDLKTLTFGNFIDLDVYFFNNPLKYWDDILKILAPHKDPNELYIWDLFRVFNQFLEYRLWIYKQYKGLFGWDEKEERDEDGELKYTNISEIAGSWFNIVCVLSGEDINKIDETTNQPLIKVLNFLSRKKDKDLQDMKLIKKQRII
jgi:hypothetical protein